MSNRRAVTIGAVKLIVWWVRPSRRQLVEQIAVHQQTIKRLEAHIGWQKGMSKGAARMFDKVAEDAWNG
jgi:hypothetical protein